jgi:hypothetical protein
MKRRVAMPPGRSSDQKARKTFYIFTVLLVPFIIASCEQATNLSSGGWTARVQVAMYDEFNRPIPALGTVGILLDAKDRSMTATISAADSVCIFQNLPYQVYTATASKDGFYPSSGQLWTTGEYEQLSLTLPLYPHPSLQTRIDSIECLINAAVPQVRGHFITAQTVPAGGSRSIVLFAGTSDAVSSRFGTYVFILDGIQQSPGSRDALSIDFYRDLHASGVTPGTKVFITGRIRTNATSTVVDQETGLKIYTNLEDQTHAIATFIMP